MKKGFEYTLEYFKKCLIDSKKYDVLASKEWSNDPWYKEQDKREFIKNEGYYVINPGKAEGTIIGGNVGTFNLLQGTEFMPSLKDSILFVEDDSESKAHHFDRDLLSLIYQPGFESVRGIIIGRFEKTSEMTNKLVYQIIKSKKELEGIPVIYGADFGHTTPQLTFPIGGRAKLSALSKKASIEISKH